LAYSTTFEHKLDNTTTYKAYDAVQEWVRTQNGKVKENHRPNLIVAVFGTSSTKEKPWEKKARKTIRFELTQPGSQVLVKVHVSSNLLRDTDVASHGDEARFNWSQTLTTLWTRFGKTDAEEEIPPTPPASWTRAIEKGKMWTRIGAVVTGAGYLLVVFYPSITTTVISGAGLIILVNGMTKVRRARKNMLLLRQQ
jgi:hypothetical protein